MASAPLIITPSDGAAAPAPSSTGLFAGLSFFLLQRLPSRSSYMDKIHANGGRVVKVEKQADHVIADHYRKDCPGGSISYTFIDAAIAHGELPDPANHATGPEVGTVRAAGSGLPTKGTRTPFTKDDDLVLWRWVEPLRRAGGKWKGNEIYKQLEIANPRHTFQAWRDRYLKRVVNNPPTGADVTVSANAPPSPPTAQDEHEDVSGGPAGNEEAQQPGDKSGQDGEFDSGGNTDEDQDNGEAEDKEVELPEDDVECLLWFAEDIEKVVADQEEDAWIAFAKESPRHSAEEWQRIWRELARPAYLKQKEDETPNEDNELMDEVPQTESLSTSAQKRKRHNEPDKDDDQSKRQKSAEAETGMVRAWAAPASNSAEDGPLRAVEGPAIATSDINEEAQAQFDEEVLGISRPLTDPKPLPTSNMPTSDLVHGAEQQLLRESWEAAESTRVAGKLNQRTTPVRSSNMPYTGDIDAESLALGGLRALTAKNLASQQAEHRAQLLRAADLPPDNIDSAGETQDQFATYLQDVVRQSGHPEVSAENADHLQGDTAADGRDPPPQPFANRTVDTAADFDNGLPISSQQDIDGALDAMINWPESPKHAQRTQLQTTSASGLTQTKTRITYPALPTQEGSPSGSSREPELIEQPVYPRLPTERDLPISVDEEEGDNNEVVSPSPPRESQMAVELGSSYVMIDKQDRNDSQPSRVDEEDVDLSIALPDHGWGLSSPVQAKRTRPTRTQPVDPVSIASSSSSYDDSLAEEASVVHNPAPTVETQDILNAETQLPDFDFPLPPDSDQASQDELPSDPLNPPSSPPNATAIQSQHNLANTQTILEEDTLAYVEKMVILHGYKEIAVMEALRCTSMRSDLAELVLLEEKLGKGFPSDVPGIWSKDEDVILEGGDAGALKVVEKKHSWDECERRMDFLQEWRDDDE